MIHHCPNCGVELKPDWIGANSAACYNCGAILSRRIQHTGKTWHVERIMPPEELQRLLQPHDRFPTTNDVVIITHELEVKGYIVTSVRIGPVGRAAPFDLMAIKYHGECYTPENVILSDETYHEVLLIYAHPLSEQEQKETDLLVSKYGASGVFRIVKVDGKPTLAKVIHEA